MGRYHGTLHKLIDSASSSNSKTKWNQVLHYLEGHTLSDDTTAPKPNFDSPLPPYSRPSSELEIELFDQQGPKNEDTPLKIAIMSAPAVIVAALCHLGPEAAKLADARERLPLHWVCRRAPDNADTEKVFQILIKTAPETLLHRDEGGRTPMHWLFWHHAPQRTASLVRIMCHQLPVQAFRDIRQPRDSQNERYPLPDIPIPNGSDVPPICAVVPDSRHGVIPLHYAVMQGASKEALKALISEHPTALTYGDRKGRTALAWYLGAGHLLDDNKRHVSGDPNDPTATPWWQVKLSPWLVYLLVSSKVARVVDDMNRTPLHWACHFYSRGVLSSGVSSLPVDVIKILVDIHVEAVLSVDSEGKTPLHVLFSVVADHQEQEYQRLLSNRTLRDNVDLAKGGPAAFHPDMALVELLLMVPESDGQEPYRFDSGREDKKAAAASHVEDALGLLPLHIALKVATDPNVIRILIQSNPTSLIHASEEELKTPLVHAFNSEYTAPLQPIETFELLMAAYVTSRHGTFIDGRVALKMEDTNGNYPLHYACGNDAGSEIIQAFVEKFPHCAVYENADGDMPLHCLLSQDALFRASTTGAIKGATLVRQNVGLQTKKEVAWQKKVHQSYRQKVKILVEPLRTKKHLMMSSSSHGMTPLHIAVAFEAVPYLTLYRMLDICPEAGAMLTNQEGYKFSCMDLHERNIDDSADSAEWDAVRELLFAFNPLVGDYRQKDELLEACVQLIRDEISGKGSYHLSALASNVPDHATLELKDTLSALDIPDIDVAYRPNARKKKHELKQPKKKALAGASSTKEKKADFVKSIYDDDLNDNYVVSPENSVDDNDDDDFLWSQDEEDDYDSSDDSRSWDREFTEGRSTLASQSNETQTSTGSPSHNRDTHNKQDPRRMNSDHIEEKKEEEPSFKPANIVLSDIAMRLWCFFLLYHDPKNPVDNHLKQVEAITELMDFDTLNHLVSWPVPEYAEVYLEPGTSMHGITLADVLSPPSKALYRSFQYFLGRFEFPTDDDHILLRRSSDGNTVIVKAYEHNMRTKEYIPKQEFAPGEAEASIWETGERIVEDGGYEASKFVDLKRTVCFKLTKNQESFENETQCRANLGLLTGSTSATNVLPMIGHYCSMAESAEDRRYAMDIHDERFLTLKLFGGDSIRLADYPYALVCPQSDGGDLFDYFFHHGLNGIQEVSSIGRQVASALKMMHEKGVVHGNLSMRHVTMSPIQESSSIRLWVLSDFSTATKSHNGTAFMGAISHDGSAQFQTGLLPPEMFVKLTAAETRAYQTYWEMVERVFKVKVDRKVVEPFVNLQTGATYVPRCHFKPSENHDVEVDLPELPYQLAAARESTDLWCFGLVIFTMCSGGRPLFSSNLKTGHLLNYENIVGWNYEEAAFQIYEHVEDPIAQDLLLRLLAPIEHRIEWSMENVLEHPFFNKGADSIRLVGKLIDKRQNESAAYDRKRQKIVSEKSEDNWLENRSTSVTCWNFDLLRKFNFGSDEILFKIIGKRATSFSMPCSFVILPYKLSAKNKKAKLAPTTKKDVERAEKMGVLLLSLAKACSFASQVSAIVTATEGQTWTASAVLDELKLSDDDFGTIKDAFVRAAAAQVEEFRSSPVPAALKVIERQITEIRKFFKEAGKAFLYLVDEYAGIPLVGSQYAPYPLEISEAIIDKFLVRALPFMTISVIYARGVAGGVSGLVRLIFEAAYPHVPPSWASAGSGLEHKLDETAFINEISILRKALALLYSTNTNFLEDDLRFIRDSCLKIDSRGTFGEMHRVVSSGFSLWTTKQGAAEIKEICGSFTVKDALEIQGSLEQSLKAHEDKIKSLQQEVERLSFRKELNLELPDNSTSTRQVSNESRIPAEIVTPKARTVAVKEIREAPTVTTREISDEPVIPLEITTPRAAVIATEQVQDTPTVSNQTPAIVPTHFSGEDSAPKTADAGNDVADEDDTEQELPPKEVSSTEDRCNEVKEGHILDVPSFDEALPKSMVTNEERDAVGEDGSICKSEAGESLREIMSLD